MLSQGFRITPVHFLTDYITNPPFLYFFFFYLFCLSMLHCLHQWPCRGWRSREWMDVTLLCRIILNLKLLTVSQPVHPKCVCPVELLVDHSVRSLTWSPLLLHTRWLHCFCRLPNKHAVPSGEALVVVGGRNFSKVAVNRGPRGLLISGEF